MSNLAGLPPLGLKPAKQPRDRAYLARVAKRPCCICQAIGYPQQGPSYAHHVCSGRFSQRKTPDHMAIPLCYHHHQGEAGIHTDKARWEADHGPDHGYSAATKNVLGK